MRLHAGATSPIFALPRAFIPKTTKQRDADASETHVPTHDPPVKRSNPFVLPRTTAVPLLEHP